MNNDVPEFQWVDEDPFERIQANARKKAAENGWGAELEDFTPSPAPAAEHPVEAATELKDFSADFERAVSFEKREQWDGAASVYRRILEIEPGRTEALIGLGACLLYLDDMEGALTCFEDGLVSDADRERALLGKAVALQKLNRDDEADLAYRELLQIAPNAAEPLANLIALSVARQDATAAGEYSRRLLRVDPYSKAALQGLATQALWIADYEAAAEYCSRLLDVDPVSFEAWSNLGYAKQSLRPAKHGLRSIA